SLQEAARWNEADAEIAKLTNRALVGYILADRYLHRCCYRAKYKDLRAWMARYADHPQARRIYRLALLKRPRGAARPRRPLPSPRSRRRRVYRPDTSLPPRPRLSRSKRRHVHYLKRRIKRSINRRRPAYALRLLERHGSERYMGRARYDRERTKIAKAYLSRGNPQKAYQLAREAATRSGAYLTDSHWVLGLAAYRLQKYEEAAESFQKVASAADESEWLRAAGGVWAARAWLAAGKPENVNRWLELAARHDRTFYGALARQQLGLDPGHDFDVLPRLDQREVENIKRQGPGRRGLALLQLGESRFAGYDLLRSYFRGGERMDEAYLALSLMGGMPRLSLKVGRRVLHRTGQRYDAALFPIPEWKPKPGYSIDRALLFAIVRQESEFNTTARSRSGARGLMQLMPATATFIARDRSLRRRKTARLFDPDFNVALGQKFLRHLLRRPRIRGNLFFALAAYNAGEGNLAKWRYRDDPLLFIEAMHLRETRIYVEKVLYNLWVYRHRLGQPAPSLEALAAGKPPIYKALDNSPSATARYDKN
ncbi:MAG: lytic transglycosylase domain-containing protein, partial [Pseudomonadota bacterium]